MAHVLVTRRLPRTRFLLERAAAACLVAAALLTLTACAPRTMLMKGVADQLAGQGQAEEEDLGLARDAAAFYLKLSESVLRQTPAHRQRHGLGLGRGLHQLPQHAGHVVGVDLDAQQVLDLAHRDRHRRAADEAADDGVAGKVRQKAQPHQPEGQQDQP